MHGHSSLKNTDARLVLISLFNSNNTLFFSLKIIRDAFPSDCGYMDTFFPQVPASDPLCFYCTLISTFVHLCVVGMLY